MGDCSCCWTRPKGRLDSRKMPRRRRRCLCHFHSLKRVLYLRSLTRIADSRCLMSHFLAGRVHLFHRSRLSQCQTRRRRPMAFHWRHQGSCWPPGCCCWRAACRNCCWWSTGFPPSSRASLVALASRSRCGEAVGGGGGSRPAEVRHARGPNGRGRHATATTSDKCVRRAHR